MSVHDACALYAGGCLRNISSVSPWYPLIGIPIGVHSPRSARCCEIYEYDISLKRIVISTTSCNPPA